MAFLDHIGLSHLRDLIFKKLETKVDKVNGKDLSTNDYTNDDKNKLESIEEGATKTVIDYNLDASSNNPIANRTVARQLSYKAPENHASTDTIYGVANRTYYGHAKASSTVPMANGTAAVGTETSSFARGDHVHPLQTSVSGSAGRATADGAGNVITETYATKTELSDAISGFDVESLSNTEIDGICGAAIISGEEAKL